MSNRKRSSKKVNEVEVLQVISWMDGARWEDEKSHQSYLKKYEIHKIHGFPTVCRSEAEGKFNVKKSQPLYAF